MRLAWWPWWARQCQRVHAILLLACGRPDAALVCFEKILARRPLDCHALASRAHLYAQRGNFKPAIDSLRLLTQFCPEQAAGWFNLGYALQQLEQQGEAGIAFRQALAIDTQLDRAWYGLALVLMDSQQYQAAAEALEKTTALQPMSPHGWFRLAQVRQALNQPDEAFKIVQHLRQFEPGVAAQLEQVLGHVPPAGARPDGSMSAVPARPACHAA